MNISIFHKTLTSILGLLPILVWAQPQLLQQCELQPFSPDQHDVWFFNLAGVDNAQFQFNEQGGTLSIYDDGSASVSGRIVRTDQPHWQWDVTLWLKNARNWEEWSALGRTYKASWGSQAAADAHHQEWTYWEVDAEKSRMTGVPGSYFEGDTLYLSHRPSGYDVGFQLGIGANDKNGEYGFSGWFFYEGAYEGYGDFNHNVSCETPPPCDLSLLDVRTECVDDGHFRLVVDFSGSGNEFELTDDQGTPALDGLAAGTYTYGTYANGTTVLLTLTDRSKTACSTSWQPLTADCTPPPVCDLELVEATPVCDSDSSFQLRIVLAGSGRYRITDDQGTAALSDLQAGQYEYGHYAHQSVVNVRITDMELQDCTAEATGLSADCSPPCDLSNLQVLANCNSDSTFELRVSFSGSGSYTLSDDQGTPAATGLAAGTYTYGNYPSDTPVRISLSSEQTDDCTLTSEVVSQSCVPPPPCDLEVLGVQTECTSDSTFQLVVSFNGSGNAWRISDNQGTPMLTGLTAGTYTFGNYPNDAVVVAAISNADNPACGDIVMGLTNNCAPPCLLEDLSVSTNCLNDSTFEVLVSFSGAGNTYTLSDNQGTPALSGLSAGTYTYGSYPSGTQVVIAVQDENSSLCRLLSPVVTADCAPPKPCDLELLSAEAVCLNGSSFEVHISIGGTGQAFTLTDNQGSAPLTGLSAGTYILGPYPSQSIVIFTLTDPEAANCSLTEALTADCTLPPPDNDLCSAATPIACGDVVQGRTDGATDVGVCGFCGTHADAPGVWYELIGTGDSVRIEVCGDYDTRLNVYEFGCDTLSCVTGNDAADLPGCEGGSAVSFATVAGEPYLIYVNGTAGAVGTFSLSVHCASEAPAARLSAEVVARQVQLNWELSQAQEIGQVQLERSQDLTHFQPLCRFEGAMQPKGAFTDEGVKANQRYFYRLRYQPRHGSTTYSSMLGVWVPGLQASLGEFYPNPATSLTRLTLFSPAVGKGKWQLQDQAGNVLASGNFDVAAGNQALNLPVPKLPEGVYLVRFALDGKWIGSRKLNVVN